MTYLYTPGVASAVKKITENNSSLPELTIKNNTIAVITDGSAVLGLGNVGPQAALPVMEGKCAIFSEFANLNAFPICIKSRNNDEIIKTIVNISPVFGAINLEDITAPRCFYIEKKLQEALDIPVLHDDQHATAIAVLAGLINACKITGRDFHNSKVIIVGCGAAGTAIIRLLNLMKCKDMLILDRKGIISGNRKDLSNHKKELALISNKNNVQGDLSRAAKQADILIGVSVKNIFTKNIIQRLNNNPIVFALANPDPEVSYKNAKEWGVKVFATGRNDYPNQINNALVFPGVFKGLLSNNIKIISDKMKINCAQAIAKLIRKPTANNFIPSIFDKRLVPTLVKTLSKSI